MFHVGIEDYKVVLASVAELADAQGLGPCVHYGRVGSTPIARNSKSPGEIFVFIKQRRVYHLESWRAARRLSSSFRSRLRIRIEPGQISTSSSA
jgi:hypothetical protein